MGCCGSVYDLPADPALSGVTRWQGGVLAEECAGLLKDFFTERRKRDGSGSSPLHPREGLRPIHP